MKNKKLISLILTMALAASPAFLMSGCVGSVIDVDENGNPVSKTESSSSDEKSDSESKSDSDSDLDSDSDSDSGDSSSGSADKAKFDMTDKIQDGTILHAWSWSFNTIKESMADIAAAGYTSIQTSPANACVEGEKGGMQLYGSGKWYYHYQPVDWTIGNYQLGTEDDFKAMCAEADKYGIKIIVDVVPNHTTARENQKKVSQTFIDAVGGIDKLYHKNAEKGISNYSDRAEVTTHSLLGLQDVDTENPLFQEYFLKYLNQLIADGADGFRYDTAKHIALPDDPRDSAEAADETNNFWDIIKKTDKADTIFNYGEVLQGSGERVEEYIKTIGHTTASYFGGAVRSAVQKGKLALIDLNDFKVGGSTDVVTWVESHDNYTGDGSYKQVDDDQIKLGWAIIAGIGEGTPLFFDRPYGGNADNQWGDMNRIGAAGSDLYKDVTISAINHFRNAMVGEDTTMTNAAKKKSMLLIERGSKGVILVNAGKNDEEIEIDTKLADGTYTDRGTQNGDFTAEGGKLKGTLKAGTVAVLYNEGYKDPVVMPKVTADISSFDVTGGSTSVTLHVSGADSGKYTLNGKEAEFSDGDKVDVSADDSGVGKLTLSATNADGYTSNMTFWFTGTPSEEASE